MVGQENTLWELEAESRGACRCPLGSSTHVLRLCLRARVKKKKKNGWAEGVQSEALERRT